MIRYEDVQPNVLALAAVVTSRFFPELDSVKIKYLFDLKKRTVHGKLVLGRCQKPNELARHFSIEEAKDNDGYQYIITIDKLAWESVLTEEAKVRLLRHELRHVKLVDAGEEVKFKIAPHNIEDFVEEIQLNTDDPDWAAKAVMKLKNLYKQ